MNKLKSGDIFSLTLSNGKRGFLQYIFQDEHYLGGHLVRTFDYQLSQNDVVNFNELVKSSILFYAYTRLTEGIKKGLWKKVENMPIEKSFEAPIFRETPDVYSQVKKSFRWRKFKSGTAQSINIGELNNEDRKLPVAGVFPPEAIIDWIETGWHGFVDPE